MIWDKVAVIYDFFVNLINRKVNKQMVNEVRMLIRESDNVLECACGTGIITKEVAKNCNKIIATDLSLNMLKQAKNKCKELTNTEFKQMNIINIDYEDESFDVVISGNVIHLLKKPELALNQMYRVCKTGGILIIPTYISKDVKIVEGDNDEKIKDTKNIKGYSKYDKKSSKDEILVLKLKKVKNALTSVISKVSDKISKKFKARINLENDFTETSYKEFFKKMGYKNVQYIKIEGHIPCEIAIVLKR